MGAGHSKGAELASPNVRGRTVLCHRDLLTFYCVGWWGGGGGNRLKKQTGEADNPGRPVRRPCHGRGLARRGGIHRRCITPRRVRRGDDPRRQRGHPPAGGQPHCMKWRPQQPLGKGAGGGERMGHDPPAAAEKSGKGPLATPPGGGAGGAGRRAAWGSSGGGCVPRALPVGGNGGEGQGLDHGGASGPRGTSQWSAEQGEGEWRGAASLPHTSPA